MATDLAISVDDRTGALADIAETLGSAGINIDGVSGSVTGGSPVVHLLVDDAGPVRQALADAGFTAVDEREVVVLDVEDRPGSLGEVSRRIAAAGISLDLVYLATGTRLVLGSDDVDALRSASSSNPS